MSLAPQRGCPAGDPAAPLERQRVGRSIFSSKFDRHLVSDDLSTHLPTRVLRQKRFSVVLLVDLQRDLCHIPARSCRRTASLCRLPAQTCRQSSWHHDTQSVLRKNGPPEQRWRAFDCSVFHNRLRSYILCITASFPRPGLSTGSC